MLELLAIKNPYFRYSESLIFCYLEFLAKDTEMSATLIVSNRGQITLPAATRKRFGIRGGDVVILEDRGSEIVLKPGVVLEVEFYSDEQIAEWDAADRLDEGERKQIVDAVTQRK